MIKKFSALFFVFLTAAVSFAQSPSIRLGVLKGIACTPCAYLIENREKLAVQNMSFKIYDSVQSELPALLKGDLDLAFLNPGDAAKVFNKGGASLFALGVAQNGNACLLTNDDSYSSIRDLAEKTVLCEGSDSFDVAVFNHVLSRDDSGIDSVEVDFSVPQAELANKLITGQAQYALLKEPFASVALLHSTKVRRVESLQRMYSEGEGSSLYPAMLLVARLDFIKDNADLIRRFVEVYRSAVLWTNKNPAKAASLSEKQGLGLSAAVVKASIPHAALVWRKAKAARADLEKFYGILEVTLPDEEFYFD